MIIVLGVCLWLWIMSWSHPLDDLALIQRAETADAELTETFGDEEAGPRDHVYPIDVGIYRFRIPDGREFRARIKSEPGQLQQRAKIEYLPEHPSVNRLKGLGGQSIAEWIWRKVLGGAVLFGMLVGPGIGMLWRAIRGVEDPPA